MLDKLHNLFVYDRRMDVLSKQITKLIKKFKITSILDIGAGDGKIDSILMKNCDVDITGIDVLVRPKTYIPVIKYDGHNIPKEDNSVDTTMLIDVLHHTDNPEAVFKEITRVTNKYIIIKDHVLHGKLSFLKLKLMDYVGNKQYSVSLPYNYLTNKRWKKLFKENDLEVVYYTNKLNLYTFIFHWLFDSNLHFIAVLKKGSC